MLDALAFVFVAKIDEEIVKVSSWKYFSSLTQEYFIISILTMFVFVKSSWWDPDNRW